MREVHTLLSGFICFQLNPVRFGLWSLCSLGMDRWMDGCLPNKSSQCYLETFGKIFLLHTGFVTLVL